MKIEFRIFNIKKKKMYSCSGFVLRFETSQISDDTWKYEWHLTDRVELLACSSHGDILMQYTGLSDKNGKKIFEGDIFDMQINGHDTIAIIEKELYEYVVSIYNASKDWIKYVLRYFIKYHDNFIVIGNIHENPELLEGKE